MIDLEGVLRLLAQNKVEYIIVGGVAGRIHGLARLTEDLDIVYRRTPDNIAKIVEVLRPFAPWACFGLESTDKS